MGADDKSPDYIYIREGVLVYECSRRVLKTFGLSAE